MALAIPISEPAPSPAATETGGTLTIDLAAIEANWRTLVRELLTVECAAVVKANAYGLGLEPVTTTLVAVSLASTKVADTQLSVLSGLAGLEILNLDATQIGDSGIRSLDVSKG